MTPEAVTAIGKRAEAMLDALALISADPGRLTRLYLTEEHRRAARLVAEWMRSAGLKVRMDAAGTVHGLLPAAGDGPLAGKRLLVGSHIDTVVDAGRRFLTALMAPDRPTQITHAAVATNHQEKVEWDLHARATGTVERERYLLNRLTLHVEPEEKFVGAFLKPPLYSSAFGQGFGTLYTAVYRPRLGQMELRWPRAVWPLDLHAFAPDRRAIFIPDAHENIAARI